MTSTFHSLLLYYGHHLPYHPGKWRVVAGIDNLIGGRKQVPRPVRVRRADLEWELDISCQVQRSVYYMGLYEVHESAWMRRNVQPDWVCFDIGANFGYFSLILASLTTAGEGRVVAFEPSPRLHQKLRRNLELNEITHVLPEELALADKQGVMRFIIAGDDNQGLGHLQQTGEEGNPDFIEVTTDTLDHYVEANGIDRLDFLKADVEGAEISVLSGAEQTLGRFKPAMMIELNPSALERAGSSGNAMLQRIHALGYQTFTLRGTRLHPLSDASVVKDYCNLLCLHPDRHAAQIAAGKQ